MDNRDVIVSFLECIKKDPCIDAKHIAIYASLYLRWIKNEKKIIRVKSRILMKEAKISSSATYFSKLNYLVANGYVKYYPSKNSKSSSSFFLK